MEIVDFLKEYWIVAVLFLFTIAVIIVVGSEKFGIDCKTMKSDYCEKDEDCVCMDQGCFLGNKNYYDKCVDKSEMCYDFCYGWDQPKPACIEHRCIKSRPMV